MSHSQPWAFQGHLVEFDRYDDPRRANIAAGRANAIVLGPHRKVEPLAPFDRNKAPFCEVHSGCSVGGHHGKSGLDRDDVHSLPGPIQDKTLIFEYSHD